MAIQRNTLLPTAAKNGKRLILLPAPMQGHMSPMLHLANLLHSKGFSITIIYTNFNAPNISKYPQFTFRAIDDGLPASIKDAVPNIVDLPILVHNVIEPFRDCLAQLLEENKDSEEPIPCLIVDALWSYTGVIREKFTIPLLVLWTESLSTALVEDALPVFRKNGYLHDLTNQGFHLEASVPEYPMLKFKDIDNILAHHPEALFSIMTNMINEMKGATGIIWNACRELEQPEIPEVINAFPAKNFLIGPIHKYAPSFSSSLVAQDPTVIPWLDSQAARSVVYVSFGSMPHIGETEFLEMAWGLANCKKPFLWVVRPGSVSGSKWIESLPEGFLYNLGGRGHIVKWAPQLEVLAHPSTAVFLTHNGWNSTVESICEGVPMICSHGIMDQPINSRYVSGVWKVGVGLENGLDREEIKRAVERLMEDKEGEEIRERATGLKETINRCTKKGGSSHQAVESLVDYILSLGAFAEQKHCNGAC